jgi:hypothetical protein
MEFEKYIDIWSSAKKLGMQGAFNSREDCWLWHELAAEEVGNPFVYRRVGLERAWTAKDKPYYNLYPAILPMLLSIKLDIPCAFLKHISVQPIEVRLPAGQKEGPLVWEDERGELQSVRSVLFGVQEMPRDVGADELIDGLVIGFDAGERDEANLPVLSFKSFPLRDDLTVEEAAALLPKHQSADSGMIVPEDITRRVIQMCACLALIDQDSDIITPDILAKHSDRWERASDADKKGMAEMAKRRGKWAQRLSTRHTTGGRTRRLCVLAKGVC